MPLFGQQKVADPPVELTGPRVSLRAPCERDWRAFAELRTASRAFLEPWEPIWPGDALTRAGFRQRVARHDQERRQATGHSFLIFDLDGAQLYGGVGVTNIRRGVAQAGTLGYWIGEAHAGQGLMGEAVTVVLSYCFDALDLHRVEAACLPSNEASRRVLERAGLTREGYAERYLKIAGTWQDHLLFAMLAEDFTGT